MNMDILDKIIYIIKSPIRIFVLVMIVSAALLFLPQSLMETLRLSEFMNLHGKYVGIIFLLSSCYITMILSLSLKNKIDVEYKKSKPIRELNNLTIEELLVLREFVLQQRVAIHAPAQNTDIVNLINKNILVRVPNFVVEKYILVGINPSIREWIIKKYKTLDAFLLPETIELPENETEQKKLVEKILSKRAVFTKHPLYYLYDGVFDNVS
jgi:hypothetical protein